LGGTDRGPVEKEPKVELKKTLAYLKDHVKPLSLRERQKGRESQLEEFSNPLLLYAHIFFSLVLQEELEREKKKSNSSKGRAKRRITPFLNVQRGGRERG